MAHTRGVTITRHGGMDVLQAVDHRDDGLTAHLIQLSLRNAFLEKSIDDIKISPLNCRGIGAGIANPAQPG